MRAPAFSAASKPEKEKLMPQSTPELRCHP
jgi:hypothetical protein